MGRGGREKDASQVCSHSSKVPIFWHCKYCAANWLLFFLLPRVPGVPWRSGSIWMRAQRRVRFRIPWVYMILAAATLVVLLSRFFIFSPHFLLCFCVLSLQVTFSATAWVCIEIKGVPRSWEFRLFSGSKVGQSVVMELTLLKNQPSEQAWGDH